MKRIAILGAGLTGLTLAYKLAQSGHKVTVFEKEASVGGIARTLEFDGQYYDLGPHEFCTNNTVLIDLLKELLEDDFLVCHKKAAQFFMGKFIDFPVRPGHFFRQIDKTLILRILAELVYYRFRNLIAQTTDYSFEHWVTNRFGSTMYGLYFKPYTEKVWGIDPTLLDPRTASDRIAFNSVFDIIHQTVLYYLFGKEQYGSAHSPLKSRFYYARKGIGTLVERLHEKCLEKGCDVRTDWEVRHVLTDGHEVSSVVNERGEVEEGYDLYINTIPITTLNVTLDRPELNSNLQFRAMVFCFLEMPVAEMSQFHWIYFPEARYSFQRLTEFSHFNAGMTKPGRTGVCAEIACFETDQIWKADDREIVESVKREMAGAGFIKDPGAVRGWVAREKYAYPIQVNGFIEHVRHSISYIESIRNLVTTGRQGLYKYCNMNECMEMAIDMAGAIDRGEDIGHSLESKWKGFGIKS